MRRRGPSLRPRTLLFHALLHGIRHYAQLATLTRQAGHPANVAGDYLFMDAQSV
jgi:uncharacterized damage-inducible protein DinB